MVRSSSVKPIDLKCFLIWEPVSIDMVILVIDKAIGPDITPPALFKNDLLWWALVIAALFMVTDPLRIILYCWKQAIVVPIYKKGNRKDPVNYSSLSFGQTIHWPFTS